VQTGLAELVERWPDAAGPAIARNAWPARIARDGTLHIATTDSIWAFELGHRAAEIAARLGVAKVRFAPGPLPSSEATAAGDTVYAPGPEELRQAAEIAAAVEDENLRESVQKAVSFSLAKRASDRPV
jgi:hypothetical protein